jgi:hypothetical protein
LGSNEATKSNSISWTGTIGLGVGTKVAEEMAQLGTADTLAVVGGPDHNRATLSHAQPISLPGGKYIGIRPEQTSEGYGYVADREYADSRRRSRLALDVHVNDEHIGAARATGLDSLFNLSVYSISSGHTKPAREMLEDRGIRLPAERRLGYTLLPHEQYLRDKVRTEYVVPLNLKDSGLVEASVMSDNRSAIVQRFGRPYQDTLVAKGLAGVMSAIWQWPNQRGPADVAHALGAYGAVTGMGFGVRHLLPGAETYWWGPVRRFFGLSARGTGDIDDIVIQVIQAASDALEDANWRAIDEDPDFDKQGFMVLTVPVKQPDAKKWGPLVTEVECWFDEHYRNVNVLWVSGNGAPHPDLAHISPYWLQASFFYPMPDKPRPIQGIIESPSMVRRVSNDLGQLNDGPGPDRVAIGAVAGRENGA